MSGDQLIDSLLGGTKWGGVLGSGVTVSYSFPGFGSLWSTSTTTGYGPSTNTDREPWSPSFGPLSTSQVSAAGSALQAWANVANVTFSASADTSTTVGDIRFAWTHTTTMGTQFAGYGYYPAPTASAGDIWFNTTFGGTSLASFAQGSFGYYTLLHEIGHVLGLKHPFETTASNGNTLPDQLDEWHFTVMSYEGAPGTSSLTWSYQPTTPMSLDIAAAQYLYGPNLQYHSGDDLYTYSAGQSYFETIWDAGGNDTIQYIADSDPSEIDLRPAALSNLGNTLYTTDLSHSSFYTVVIYDAVTIENAIGGDGPDLIYGNDVANSLEGRGGPDTILAGIGDDSIEGGNGNDSLEGGPGQDRFDWGASTRGGDDTLVGGPGDDTYVVFGNDQIVESMGEGADTLWAAMSYSLVSVPNIEHLYAFGSDPVTVTGNSLDNTIRGNAADNVVSGLAGNDLLYGEDGNDRIDGGDDHDDLDGSNGVDTLYGGAGNDILRAGSGLWTDSLSGGDGDDTYELYNVASQVYENAGEGRDTVRSYAWNTTLWDNVEDLELVDPSSNTDGIGNALGNVLKGNIGSNRLSGVDGDDILIGNAGNDTLDGGNGSDVINGGAGNDTLLAGSGLWTDILVGAAGDDLYEVYNVASPVYENAGEGRDTVRSYAWNTTLWDNVEDLELVDPSSNTDGVGNALGNVIKGNIGSNRLNGVDGDDILIGNAGKDTLDGGNGSDVLNGGDGADTLLAGSGLWTDILVGAAGDDLYELYNVASQLYENPGEGTDTLRSYAWATTLPENVEHLLLVDAVNNVDGTGNAQNNQLTGNAGNNVLNGLGGSDTLTGGAGADTLTGGSGQDTFVMRSGDGGSSLTLADVITDYQDGTDLIGLGGGLTYADLTIAQGTGPNANHTIIQKSSGEYLAILQNVNSSVFDILDFKPIV